MSDQQQARRTFIVGVGASTGGLEAFQQLLAALGDAPGFAIVLVQAVDPFGKPELSQSTFLHDTTSMKIVDISRRRKIRPNTIYVCPAQGLLEVDRDWLVLVQGPQDNAPSMPIDHFFHSLAESQREDGVGIVLSGPGSDGTLGLKSISDRGGMTFAQDAQSAKFDSMPRNAATTGVADHVLPPAAIASELLKYVAFLHQSSEPFHGQSLRESIERAIPDIAERLLQETNHDFQHYKSSTLCRRIQRRMQLLKIRDVSQYVERVHHDADEVRTLFRELLIGVTAFFRDPEAFERLAHEVLPKLFANRTAEDPVRIWVPGCATGEEAYTIAILCREFVERLSPQVHSAIAPSSSEAMEDNRSTPLPSFQIFASDIDERALSIARQGIYPAGIAQHVSEERLKRFFVKKGKRYHVNKEIRETVLFSPHNLISDPPFSRQDLVSCRNLLIYLGPHLQKKLIPLFHFALRPNGFLFLGPSESITAHGDLFRPIDTRNRISQRKGTAIGRTAPLKMRSPSSGITRPPGSALFDDDKSDIVQIMQRIVLDEFSPKSVVVDEEGQVICTSAETSKYLTIGEGAYQNNILKMARQGLRIGLRATLGEAKAKRRRVTHENLSVQTSDGKQRVMITVQPMMRLGEENGLFMVVFHDVGLPMGLAENEPDQVHANNARASLDRQADAMIEQLERELQTTREDLEKTMQEMEAANEELKSSNEELLSMNEELQSANEELETSKEEIRVSSDAVARANTDLENLLRSTQIATIFLDDDLGIRSFTQAATEIYSLIATDTGRPLTQIVPNVCQMPPLPDAASLEPGQAVAHTVTANNGRTYIRRVLPYRDEQDQANGLVVTFTDVSDLEESRRRLQTFTDAVPPLMAIVDRDQRFIFVNQAYAKHWQRRSDQIIGCTIAEIVSDEAYQKIAPQMQKALAGEQVRYELVLHRRGTDELMYEEVIYVPQWGRDGEVEAVHVVITDQTELRSTRADLISRQQQLDLALEAGRLGTWSWDVPSGQVAWSRHIYELFGYTQKQFDHTQAGFLKVVHPDDRDHVAQVIETTFADRRKEYEVEFRVIRPDNGQTVWSFGQGIVEYNNDGQPIKITGTSSDITERKERELNLAFLESLQAAFNPQLSSHQLIELTCTKLAHHLQLSRCTFAEVDQDANSVNLIFEHNTVSRERGAAGESRLGVKHISDLYTAQEQQDFLTGRLVSYDDVALEISDSKQRAHFEAAGIAAVCNTASVSHQRIRFILAGHKDQAHRWLEFEKELIRETAQRLCVRVERARAEQDVIEREQRLQLALDSGSMGLWEWDIVTNRITWSPHMFAMFGYTPETFNPTKEGFLSVVHPDDRTMLTGLIHSAFARECESHEVEFRVIHGKDESIVWTHCRGVVKRNESGDPVSITSVAVDVTQRKQWETELVDREAHLRRVINNQLGLVGVIGRDGTLLEVDDDSMRIAGLNRDDVIGKHFAECAWWTYDEAVAQQMRESMERAFAGETVRYDVPLYAAGLAGPEARLMIDFMLAPVFDEKGQVEFLIPSGVDISERHAAEVALRESQQQLQVGIEVAKFGLGQIDYRNNTIHLSAEAARLYGVAEEATTVSRAELHQRFHPDDQETLNHAIAACLASPSNGLLTCEHRITLPDGDVRWLDVREQVFYDRSANPPTPSDGILAARDITAHKQLEAKLREHQNYLRRVIDSTTNFIGVFEPDGTACDVNMTALQATGLKRENLIGAKFWEFSCWSHDPSIAERVEQAVLKCGREGERVHLDTEFLAADGSIRMVEIGLNAVRDADERIINVICSGIDITQRHRADVHLRESESRFRTMADGLPLVIWLHDAAGKLLSVNRAYCEFFGVEEQDMHDMKWQELVHPDDFEAYTSEFARCVAQRCDFHAEVRVKRADGQWRWHESWGQSRFSDSGEYLGHIGASADVTDRREALEKLEDSRQRLMMAMDSARMGSFWWEPQSDRCDWDDQWYDAMGVSRELEKSGKTFFSLVHPEDLDVVKEATQRALEGDGIYKVEFRAIDQHGNERWIAGNGRIIAGQADRPTRLVGLNWDITEAKKTEQQVRLNEQRLLTAAEAAGFGMVHADLESGRMYISEQMLRLIGRPIGETTVALTDQTPDWVHPEDQSAYRAHFEQLQHMPEGSVLAIDHRIVRPDGEVRWVHLQGKPLYDTVGNKRRVTQVLGTVVDITERHQYELSLEEARRAAEAANASKSEFLANMSHEIRTPMTAILGYADLLREMVERDEAQSHLLTIRRNGDYLLEIINDILDLSKIEAGKFEVEQERFEPRRLVEDVRSIMALRASEDGLSLEVEYHGKLPKMIQSDAKRLKQILINLVGNAIKFTHEGRVHIRVHYAPDQRALYFDVVDTGVGMSPEQQHNLFKPFSQGDASVSRSFGGTGLGLAISQRLAEMLGGKIAVSSTLGVGSTFTVSVAIGELARIELVDYDRSPADQKAISASPAQPLLLNCHVLIVDDRRDIRFLSKHILTKAGATVEECEDGQLAVDRIAACLQASDCPDLILLDMQMPNLDGYQTARKLRELGYDRPIVALTADAMQGNMHQCLEAGCNDYLSKPIDAGRLLQMVSELT